MKIQDQDLYHGAALTQIVEHESFKALNRAGAKYGHYLVNTNQHVFVKYRTNGKSPWSFTLQPDELNVIRTTAESNGVVFLCLVCGNSTICGLSRDEVKELIDLASRTQQWIKVEVPPRGSCRVSGSAGNLNRTIPHKAFPAKIFDKQTAYGE